MDLTHSYERVFPADVLARYEFDETRNAAAVLSASDPQAFEQLVDILRSFTLPTSDLTSPGRNESQLAGRLNRAIRAKGWREAQVNTRVQLSLRRMPYAPAGEKYPSVLETEVSSTGYKVDAYTGRVALDVEWNAKDGNLDRDIGAYRALYELGLIDVGILWTRTHYDLRELAYSLRLAAGMSDAQAATMLGTTTTTNSEKLRPRLTRGDSGGCPVLAVYISPKTWKGSNTPAE